MHTTSFWNNVHQVCLKVKVLKNPVIKDIWEH